MPRTQAAPLPTLPTCPNINLRLSGPLSINYYGPLPTLPTYIYRKRETSHSRKPVFASRNWLTEATRRPVSMLLSRHLPKNMSGLVGMSGLASNRLAFRNLQFPTFPGRVGRYREQTRGPVLDHVAPVAARTKLARAAHASLLFQLYPLIEVVEEGRSEIMKTCTSRENLQNLRHWLLRIVGHRPRRSYGSNGRRSDRLDSSTPHRAATPVPRGNESWG